MTDSNIVSLHGGRIETDRRAMFLNDVAGAYDAFVEQIGQEPDAIVLGIGGVKQGMHTHWTIEGESGQAVHPTVSYAVMALTRALLRDDED